MSGTPKSNVVTITDKSGTLTALIYAGSCVVTSGESYLPPPTILRRGQEFTITFSSDRKSSKDVASKFNSICGGKDHEYETSGGDEVPGDLNFYFNLKATFTTTQGTAEVIFYLAQGHFIPHNNWWIGGSIVNSNKKQLEIPITNTLVLNLPLSGNHESFTFGLGNITN